MTTTSLAANVERWCLDLPPRTTPNLPHHAYAGPAAAGRRNPRVKRHAVPWETHVAGHTRPDAECGYLVTVNLGRWDPAHPDNCPDCAQEVAR